VVSNQQKQIDNKTMNRIKTVLATLAVVACAVSAMAIQNQTIWVSDSGGGISLVPATSTSGAVVYSGGDAFWTVVISTGVASPPAVGQGTLTAPVLDLNVQATSAGGANASLHPLSITFGADGYGPTAGMFNGIMSGHVVSGSGQSMTFNTYYEANNTPIANPSATLLTAQSFPDGATYNGTATSGAVNLAALYALEEVVTLQANANGATYSLDGSLISTPTGVPDGGTTAMLLGAALSVLGLIRRKLA
jgi:hypothetical protein